MDEFPLVIESLGDSTQVPSLESSSDEAKNSPMEEDSLTEQSVNDSSSDCQESSTSDSSFSESRNRKSPKKRKSKKKNPKQKCQQRNTKNSAPDEDFSMEQSDTDSSFSEESASGSESSSVSSRSSENDSEYEVEKILSKSNGAKVSFSSVNDLTTQGIYYKVKWVGYSRPTWEPAKNLGNCKKILEDFKKRERRNKKKNKKTPSKNPTRFKIKSSIKFESLLRFPSLSHLVRGIELLKTTSTRWQTKSALTLWVTFLLQKTKNTLKQLMASSPGLVSYFSDLETVEEFWDWYRTTTGHTNPSTLKNFVDKMRSINSILISSIDDRVVVIKLGEIGRFWKGHSSVFNRDATRWREHHRRVTVMKDEGKFLTKQEWQTISQVATSNLESIIEDFDPEEDQMDNKTAKTFVQSLLWVLGLSLGLPRTTTFTLMEIGNTLNFRNGKFFKFFLSKSSDSGDKVKPGSSNGYWEFSPKVRKNSGHKERTPFKTYSIPRQFNGQILFFLDFVRPFLLQKKKSLPEKRENSFWISMKGNSLSSNAHLDFMKDFLHQVIGRKLTFRELRLNLNAQFHTSDHADKEESRFWFNYLMDHCEATANKYYVLYQDELMVRESSNQLHPYISELFSPR